MAYATPLQAHQIYGTAYFTDILPLDVVDGDAMVAEALATASDEIDGYLSARYTLPLASLPAVLKRPCIDMAAYVLASRHASLTDEITKRYGDAVAFLSKIASGKAGLGRDEPQFDSGGDVAASSSGSSFSARERLFGRGVL